MSHILDAEFPVSYTSETPSFFVCFYTAINNLKDVAHPSISGQNKLIHEFNK